MLVRKRKALIGTPQYVATPVWSSTRFFVKSDNLGYSLHETIVEAGSVQTLWYKNHLEACLLLEGAAEIEDLATGKTFALEPGDAYALNKHDKHIYRSITRTRLVCVFSPALSGSEKHDKDGSYSLD